MSAPSSWSSVEGEASLSPELLSLLRCPLEGTSLRQEGSWLLSETGRRYPIVQGIPVLLADEDQLQLWVGAGSLAHARRWATGQRDDPYAIATIGLDDHQLQTLRAACTQLSYAAIDPVASALVAATNGIAYLPLVNTMTAYPMPETRLLMDVEGCTVLDIGCSWGRWVHDFAKHARLVVGVDPSLGAVLAAQRIAHQLGTQARCAFVVADARRLPFANGSFDRVYSYSVIQHFSRDDAELAFASAGRTLKRPGQLLIQMANAWGLRSLQHQARRRFREGTGFNVRYWTPAALRALTRRTVGEEANLEADGYFGLGMRSENASQIGGWRGRLLRLSGWLVSVSKRVAPLTLFADSLFVRVVRLSETSADTRRADNEGTRS